jgi:glycosyltransferase involved in cell wall biosynthesis
MIAFANFCCADEISGVSTWFERLVTYCHQSGMPVAVLLHGLGQDAHTSPIYRSLRDARIPITYSPKPHFTEDGVRATLHFLNEFQPKVFVPQCLEHFYYAADFAAGRGLPWIFTIHSDDPVYWAIAKLLDLNQSQSSWVGVSKHICELAQQFRSGSIEQIPCGVKILNRTAIYQNTPFRLIYCGRVVEEQKRISLVIRSMALACQRSPNIECLVIGDGPQRQEMQAFVESAGLVERIQFLGRLDSSQLFSELEKSQAILLLSDYEGLPVALMEAMAMGVVPLARNIASGIPELVRHEHSGLLVDDEPAKVAGEIVRLASDPALWMRCSDNARQLVTADYSDYVCFERWRRLLQEKADAGSIHYPLPIPKRISLKAVPPELIGRDTRRISSMERIRNRFGRLLKRTLG